MSSTDRSLHLIGRSIVLLLTSLFLLPVFSVQPMKLRNRLAYYALSQPAWNQPASKLQVWKPVGTAQDLIKTELQKTIDEIKLRIEEEDAWFHYKILLVGGLLIAFLQYIKETKRDQPGSNQRLEYLFNSQSACSALALACIIALAIDIHVRNNTVVIQQLALWIANFAEPALLQLRFPVPELQGAFLPWEQFLRVGDPGTTVAGMHQDNLYGFAFYPHLHLLTWLLYSVYLVMFQQVNLSQETPPRQERSSILIFGFVLVHLTLAILAWIGHAAPSAFKLRLIPFNEWCWGWQNSVLYLVPVLLVSVGNLLYAFFLQGSLPWQRRRGVSGGESASFLGPADQTVAG